MKRINFITTIAAIAALLLFAPSVSTAQVQDFKAWLSAPQGELSVQRFANKKLSKADSNEAAYIIDSLWLRKSAQELGPQWQRMTISHDSIKLACACRVFGAAPKDGRSLYISMHGGGHCPKEVNDEQWMNQIYLYEPAEGVYIAPRAPWNTSDLWHRKGLDEMLEDVIRACVVFEGVNPNKVYLMGYSAGGDGVWRLAPRMADKWAAASMMAGHPGESSQINLINTPYMIWMGEHDHYYNRNTLAKEKSQVMDSLSAAHPGKYIHSNNIIEGKGHWMDRVDTAAIGWMAQYRRAPYPKQIVWRQEFVTREHFYWLTAPADEVEQGKTVIANIDGNDINIAQCDYSKLTIYLNDHLVDLDKKVTIRHNGKKIARVKPRRTIANLHHSLNLRNDRSYAFPCIIEVKMK
ncbi:MAG: dienelactone hydrolase family protein [Bacteroidaceae bacterium]|nr:dienelactone hydrolase family protein [Bacteroidaceae bacterium]